MPIGFAAGCACMEDSGCRLPRVLEESVQSGPIDRPQQFWYGLNCFCMLLPVPFLVLTSWVEVACAGGISRSLEREGRQ